MNTPSPTGWPSTTTDKYFRLWREICGDEQVFDPRRGDLLQMFLRAFYNDSRTLGQVFRGIKAE